MTTSSVAAASAGAGEQLWLLAADSTEPGLYYFNSQDGPWRKQDTGVAHESIRGLELSYVAIQADDDCDQALRSAVQEDQEAGVGLPPTCVELSRVTLSVR